MTYNERLDDVLLAGFSIAPKLFLPISENEWMEIASFGC